MPVKRIQRDAAHDTAEHVEQGGVAVVDAVEHGYCSQYSTCNYLPRLHPDLPKIDDKRKEKS